MTVKSETNPPQSPLVRGEVDSSPDETTSHSTRQSKDDSQVAGYDKGRPGGVSLHPSLPVIHSLGLVEYLPTWDAMKKFTTERTPDGQTLGTRDEIWLVQHPPTYTQGLAGKPEHLLHPTHIPVIKIDRGGQITYHGPGQIVAYLLLDLRRWKINVRELVTLMEQAVIDLLGEFGVAAKSRKNAPGVYVDGAKIAALGLKIKNSCCYHGLSLNVNMDLTPFDNINPCGHAGLRVTQCAALGITAGLEELQALLAQNLIHGLQRYLESKQHELP